MLVYPNLNTIFLLFFFLSAIEDIMEASARLKSEVPGWADPPQLGPPKF